MNKSWESQHYEPLLVTGITGAFEEATEMLRKVTLLSEIKDDYNACVPIAVKDALKIFSNINSGSSKEECLRFLEFLKNIPVKNRTASYDFQRGKRALTDFYAKFEKLRHLVEDRLEIPLERWIQIKEDEKNFPVELDKLNSESENIHEEVEIATHLGDQIPPEMKDEIDRERKLSSASEDSSYQHPFLVRANAERYIELLETFNEKKLEELQKQQNEAKAGFEEAKLKYRKEIRKIMEETLRTKEFAEWLKAKNKARLKEYQDLGYPLLVFGID
ncbi:uncharacterized protein LOC118190522 isoform X2 [Stegodyphus dumicola]|uniref:uncharacterized protein LOC118190522 isoform X2 n=1 Tax=Stegodyphus dumicola TaxID=202533 RepID=UPI0015A92E14|nr:uncharacterized protein LOC118190522 isoform X2 [Stegodyphus dumicola]